MNQPNSPASAERKAISKSVRFEVFKRDSFKCQYCGAVAPDVLLQVDHILAVANGGTNEILNLITSCEPCNNGKRAILLDDNVAVSKARNQLEALQERREQRELMMEWQYGLRDLAIDETEEAARFFDGGTPGWKVNDNGKKSLKKLIRKFGLAEVLTAMRKSTDAYLEIDDKGHATSESVAIAMKKIGGICATTRAEKEEPGLAELMYVRAIVRNRLTNCYYVHHEALSLLREAHSKGVSMADLKSAAQRVKSWTNFCTLIDGLIKEAW